MVDDGNLLSDEPLLVSEELIDCRTNERREGRHKSLVSRFRQEQETVQRGDQHRLNQ